MKLFLKAVAVVFSCAMFMNASHADTKKQYKTVHLPEGRYAKVGRAQIIFCRNYGGKHRDLKAANLPISSNNRKRNMLWMKDQCFPKTLEFQYEIVDETFFGGAILIRVGTQIEGRNERKFWVYRDQLQRHTVKSYKMNYNRELFDQLRWD